MPRHEICKTHSDTYMRITKISSLRLTKPIQQYLPEKRN